RRGTAATAGSAASAAACCAGWPGPGSLILPGSLVARRLVEEVAHAAHGADIDAERLELLAHPVDVDLDRVRADVVAEAEQVLDHLLLAHHAPLPRQQQLDHRP